MRCSSIRLLFYSTPFTILFHSLYHFIPLPLPFYSAPFLILFHSLYHFIPFFLPFYSTPFIILFHSIYVTLRLKGYPMVTFQAPMVPLFAIFVKVEYSSLIWEVNWRKRIKLFCQLLILKTSPYHFISNYFTSSLFSHVSSSSSPLAPITVSTSSLITPIINNHQLPPISYPLFLHDLITNHYQ